MSSENHVARTPFVWVSALGRINAFIHAGWPPHPPPANRADDSTRDKIAARQKDNTSRFRLLGEPETLAVPSGD